MATTVENVEIRVDANQANTVLRNLERNIDGVTNNFRDFAEGVRDGMTQALREAGLLDAATNKLGNSTKIMKDFAAGVKSGMNSSLKETAALTKNIDTTAKSLDTLGKSARTNLPALGGGRFLSLEALTGGLVAGNILRTAYQQAIDNRGMSAANFSASMAADKLSENFKNLQQALINVLQPLNDIVAGVSITTKQFEAFIKIILAVGSAFIVFRVASAAIAAISTAMASLGTTTGVLAGIFQALRTSFKTIIDLFKVAFERGTRFGDRIIAIVVGLIDLAKNAGIAAAAVYALKQAYNIFFDTAEKSPPQIGRIYSKQDLERMNQAEKDLSQQRIDAMKAADDLLRSTSRQNQSTLEQLRLQNKLFGASEDYAEIQRTLLQQEQTRRGVVQGISDQIAAGVAPSVKILLEQQIASYLKLQTAADAQAIAEIKALQKKRAELAAYNAQLNTMVELSAAAANRRNTLADILGGQRGALGDVLFQRSQLGRGGIQQQIASAYEDARKAAREAQQQFAATFPEEGFTPETAREFQQGLDAIAKSFEEVAYQTENNILISQQWKTGWDEAFNNFIDNALNAADRARTVFSTIVGAMENALDNFVRTGKFGFKDLVRSIIADLTSQALIQAFRNLLIMPSIKTGGWLSVLGSFFAGFFAKGGYIPPGKVGIVGEAGPELVGGPTTVTPLNGTMGGGQQVINNYYINALDAKSVAQLFSENRRTLLGATEQARKEMPIRQRF